MMKWIEKIHEELNLQLDTLPPEVIQVYEKEGFKQELRAMKETEEAAKKVKQLQNYTNSEYFMIRLYIFVERIQKMHLRRI